MPRTKTVGRPRSGLSLLVALCLCAMPAAASAATFGVHAFTMSATNKAGEPFTQAGGHPYALTTTIEWNTEDVPALGPLVPVQDPKDVAVDLPAGVVVNPLATSRCPVATFASSFCPGSTQVGTLTVHLKSGGNVYEDGVYNLVPPAGVPAELGVTTAAGQAAHFVLAGGLDNANEYRIRSVDEGLPMEEVSSVTLTLWGVPAYGGSDPLAGHNPQRGRDCSLGGRGCERSGHEVDTEPAVPFVTMPSDCVAPDAEAGDALLQTDSWESPDAGFPAGSLTATAQAGTPAVTGCAALVLLPNPTIEARPEPSSADAPDGLHVKLTVPQVNTVEQLAIPPLRSAVVTLPAGMSLSPAAADGLEACSDAQFDVKSSAEAKCPEKSQIGEVEVESPLLSHLLKGELFVGEPLCGNAAHPNPCGPGDATGGHLFRLFLQARGEGVTVKLPGTVAVNQATGQLTTTFAEDPQLPFEWLELHLKGGERAPLANPQSCGEARTTSDLTPWSTPYTPDATPEARFEVTGCAASMGFAPAFTAGTVTPKAGAFSPFTLTFSRHDGEQDLSGVQITTPPGLVGMLSKVPLCGEPQAQAGTCSAGSQIGTAHVASGAGSAPLWLAGSVYLTTAYNGAPFGLSIVVPAVAGPFNLGNVVVRSAINIDPNTSALTVTSGPLPQLIDGVQTRIKTVNVTVDRPGFMFNPTNCKAQQITGTIAAAQGASAHVSSPFAASGCKNLPFKPKFQVSTSAKHSRKNGAGLHVVVRSGAGQANIGSVKVNLPKPLPSRLSTLNQACLEKVFNANPASCPAGSKVGGATAYTSVLPVAMTGPAYFVSHGGAAFPDLDVVLQGDGVTVILTGSTFISKAGITTSTFATVPDVPITRFDLNLPTGAHSALAGNGSFCNGAMYMPTQIKGQNGAVVKQKTRIAVTGCPKPKRKAAKARTSSSPHSGQRRGK
jgi:hypothetical protein